MWKKILRLIHRKLTNYVYPLWDHSFFYMLISQRLKDMGDYFYYRGIAVGHEKQGKRLYVASELAKRIASDEAFQHTHVDVPEPTIRTEKDESGWYKLEIDANEPEWKSKKRWEKYRSLENYYVEYFYAILKKYSVGWWD